MPVVLPHVFTPVKSSSFASPFAPRNGRPHPIANPQSVHFPEQGSAEFHFLCVPIGRVRAQTLTSSVSASGGWHASEVQSQYARRFLAVPNWRHIRSRDLAEQR